MNEQIEKKANLYRQIWRWHFYAGIICLPFIILLSITGSIYLFKPQIENAIDAKYLNTDIAGGIMPPSLQVKAAINHIKGSKLRFYELPQNPQQAAKIMLVKNKTEYLVYVHPKTLEILKTIPKNNEIMEIAKNIHGELLMGKNGSLIVETAACWAITMFITGIYLWWPRNKSGLGGVLYIRKGKMFLRDLHSVSGIWISFFALFLLITGLPWADVWGDSFKKIRQITHTQPIKQSWTLSRAEEQKILIDEIHNAPSHEVYMISIDEIVAKAKLEYFAPPVEIAPPNKKNKNWVVRSQSQNRPLRKTIEVNPNSGLEVMRETFKDRHIIDKIIGYGISAHEGQLFGWFNQLLGVLTAVALILMSISSFLMWQKRKPIDKLGAPPPLRDMKIGIGLIFTIFILGLLMPMFGISLVAIFIIENAVLKKITKVKNWLAL